MTKRVIIIAAVAVVLGGCDFLHNAKKDEAQHRWNEARSHVLLGVAMDQFKAGDLEKAEAYASQALALDGNYVPARILMGKILLEQAKPADALLELRRAEALAPSNSEVVFLIGVALEKHTDYEQALQYYQKARALDAVNDDYVTASAEVLVKLERPQQALDLLESRLDSHNGNASMLALAGELSMLVNDPAKAVEYFRRCNDIQPDSLQMHESLAKALFFAGQYQEAIETLTALAEDKRYQEKVSWVYVMLGDALTATGHAGLARNQYETASRIDPDDPMIWASMAKASMLLKDDPRAILAARQALSLSNDCVDAALVLGYVLLRGDRPGEAIELLRPVADKHPDVPALWCTLGRCYAAQGHTDQAVVCYRQAVKTSPEDRLARYLLDASEARARWQ